MREIGTVVWFSSKGQSWGYIMRENGTQIFVHYKNVLSENQKNPNYVVLKPGQKVSFEEGPGHYTNGSQALKVKVEDEGVSPSDAEVGYLD